MIAECHLKSTGGSMDAVFVPGATKDDLDMDAVREYMRIAVKCKRRDFDLDEDPWRILLKVEKRKQFEDRRQREKKDLHLAIRMEDIQPRIEVAKPSRQQVQPVKQAQKPKAEVNHQTKKRGGFLTFFRDLFSSRLKYSNISHRVTPS